MNDFRTNFGDAYYSNLHDLSESLSESLKYFNIENIYGVGGDYAVNLLAAFGDKFNMRPSSNEMHASFSACGAAEVNGIGCCLTTYTVGSLPCISAAALAKTEGLPVIFISGAPGESEIKKGPLHHSVYCSHDWTVDFNTALNAFKALGIKAERLQGNREDRRPSIASEQFYKLILHAYTHKEPVYIEIPRDIVFTKVQSISLPKKFNEIVEEKLLLDGAQYIAQEIYSKLKVSKKPVLYIGEKVKSNKKLIDTIQEFCEKHRIPYATNLFAKGLMDDNSELSLSYYNGVFSSKATREYIENKSDYILELCTGIITQDTSSAFATGETYINSFENKTILKGTSTQGLDIIEVFKYLEEMDTPSFKFEETKSVIKTYDGSDSVNFSNICDLLNQHQRNSKESFIYIPEIGNSFFASLHLETKKSSLIRSWVSNPWYAAMGSSIPYARSICNTINQNKSGDIPVIITGDGGFHFQLNELIHFLREDLFVVIILMRNDIFHLGKGGDCDMYSCSDSRFNYKSLIEAYGGEFMHTDSVEGFNKHFSHCINNKKGIKFIEIPVGMAEEEQSKEIRLLNLYIKARSGDAESQRKWKEIIWDKNES